MHTKQLVLQIKWSLSKNDEANFYVPGCPFFLVQTWSSVAGGIGGVVDVSMVEGLAYLSSFITAYKDIDLMWNKPYAWFSGDSPIYRFVGSWNIKKNRITNQFTVYKRINNSNKVTYHGFLYFVDLIDNLHRLG